MLYCRFPRKACALREVTVRWRQEAAGQHRREGAGKTRSVWFPGKPTYVVSIMNLFNMIFFAF